MGVETLAISTPNFRFTAYAAGDGPLWVGFHGYGQGGQHLLRFMRILWPSCRCVAVDLPGHGHTEPTQPGTELLVNDLVALLSAISNQGKVGLLGFSLGGKCVLKLMETTPSAVREAWLIAPDGLYVNPFYWFATHTKLGQNLMQRVVNNPSRLFGIIRSLQKAGLLHPKVAQFLMGQMEDRHQRERVQLVWHTFRQLQPSLKVVRENVADHHLPLTVVFGANDKVIRPIWAKRITGPRCPSARFILLNRGHDLTKREAAHELLAIT